MINETTVLLRKEFLLEWRQKYALNGILLYLTSTIFIVYMSFQVSRALMTPEVWSTLFWIVILFTSMNSVAKSFIQEPVGRSLYAHQLTSATAVILSKQIYNSLLNAGLALLGLVVFSVVFANPVSNYPLFLVNLILASIGFAMVLSMLSAIASKAGQNTTLMAILSFPVVLPMLLVVIEISGVALAGGTIQDASNDLVVLLAIDLIVGAVSYMLFPYIWRS